MLAVKLNGLKPTLLGLPRLLHQNHKQLLNVLWSKDEEFWLPRVDVWDVLKLVRFELWCVQVKF